MDINEILSHCDHTNLKQTAVPNDIKRLIDEAVRYNTASVCIPPCYVSSLLNMQSVKCVSAPL